MSTSIPDDSSSDRKKNQYGEYVDVSNMTADDWGDRWAKQQTDFHMPIAHSMLVKHFPELTLGKTKQRIFLPLCGKSLDLKWLHDQGHKVVGNEYVADACKQFFEENNIPYKIEPIVGIAGDVYKATDGTAIELYRCNFFDLNSEVIGKFDVMWDRGGLVALSLKDRKCYANKILSLMKDDCQYLLDCFLLDHVSFSGPPFNCEENDVSQLFGDECTIKKIDEKDALSKGQADAWGITYYFENVYLIVPKSK